MMKKVTENQLIHYLFSQNGWTKASIIASHFQFTERTIRNRINGINQKRVKPVIISSRQGYKIDADAYRLQNKKQEEIVNAIPVTVKERQFFLIRTFLSSAKGGMNLFDLAEMLCVSEATIRRDIKSVKEHLTKFDIQVVSKEEDYQIKGSEAQKRKAMTYLIFEESKKTMDQRKMVQQLLGDIDLLVLQEIISETLEQYDYFINQYSLNNILLHFAVTLQRMREEKAIEAVEEKELDSVEYRMTKAITQKIAQQFGIVFSNAEIYNLFLLFIGNTTLTTYESLSPEHLKEYIGNQTVDIVKEVLADIGQMYFIHLSDEAFTTKFMIHVRNLISRSNLSKLSKNPLREDMKRTYPLIYDVAVSIASELEKRLLIQVNEDEIAYIALHLGAYLESVTKESDAVSCVILCPRYYDIHQGLVKKIKETYREQINIQKIVTDMSSNWQIMKPELIISISPFSEEVSAHFVLVHPFLTDKDYKNISDAISKVKQNRKQIKMTGYIKEFFRPEFFYRGLSFKHKNKAIYYMTEQLFKAGYVSSGFTEKVLAREKLSSTAFSDGVAVPHALKMNAIKTAVSVAIFDEPIDWDGKVVYIVAIFAVNKENRPIFSPMFENFIRVLSEGDNIRSLSESENYEDFTSNLIQLMGSE
ncbi:MAG: PRD domain-containing protein [Carnobacterium sp.]|uniref:BglG family transcription antiterminator n=1 Tax=Carnobacterium sp. TaxID=48221 RepID=UPI002FCB4BE3